MRIPCLDLGSFLSRSMWTTILGLLIPIINIVKCGGDIWPLERPEGMPSIQSLEVMCGKDHMDVHLSFSHPFEGIVSSKGQHGDPRCIYVPPSTGQTFFSFRIAYARCGTKPDLNGQFYENTVVVQYDKDLLEVWDEAKRLRCEWFNDYEKTASKPPMVIADLDVIQLDFRGDNVDCWMEIQHGKGPWAPPVSGIVPLGSTLTLVVAINDYRGEFDMRVKSCIASDGGGHVIQLSDEFGCVLRPKMISRFLKARGADERASVITYAFFHAFKFPDALSVHIKCKVEICRHGCLDHCQVQPGKRVDLNSELHHYMDTFDRKDEKISDDDRILPDPLDTSKDDIYDDIIQEGEGGAAIGNDFNGVKMALNKKHVTQDIPKDEDYVEIGPGLELPQNDKFPQGPRNLVDSETPVAAPRSFPNIATTKPKTTTTTATTTTTTTSSPTTTNTETTTTYEGSVKERKRRKRSLIVSDRKARSADVGVSSIYEVISEADLAFSPDTKAEAVTVFQGKIREEVVYGICMPVPGFSILFIIVALSAVISALVAGSLLYRYQLQRERIVTENARHHHHHQQHHHQNGAIAMNTFVNWMGVRFLKNNSTNKNLNKTQTTTATNGNVSYDKKSNGKTED